MNLPFPRPTTSRRFVLLTLAVSGAGLVCAPGVRAQALVDEKDPQAAALGYVADASKTDVKKFPKFEAGQHCGNCALYQGKSGDKAGPCPLFAGKQVADAGWCAAWAKKA